MSQPALDEETLDFVAGKLCPGLDPRDYFGRPADTLVRDGWLTPFQLSRVARGDLESMRLGENLLVLDRLGVGGAGHVFLCEHRPLARLVAVKVLPPGYDLDRAAVVRFEREARVLAAIDHPNVIRVFDFQRVGRNHFATLEFIDGSDLYRYVQDRGPLHVAQAANYVAQAARGLQRLADAGWVHGDVKPNNLVLDRSGAVKVIDLDLARRPGEPGERAISGTPRFMAPEVAIGEMEADLRSDVYSLGATMWFLLTGQAPEGSPKALPASVPPRMASVLARMLAPEPHDRFVRPFAVAAALTRWSAPATAAPAAVGFPVWSPAIRRRMGGVGFTFQLAR